MTTKHLLTGVSLSTLVLAAFGQATPAPATLKLPQAADLGGPDRYLTFVSTDKPIYRADDKVFIRAVLLNAATHQPLGDQQNVNAQVQILDPKGSVVAAGNAAAQGSVIGFNWTVPASASGGEYTLKVDYPFNGYAPAQRKFDVRVYRAPRLRSQVNFVREGYGPGDKVFASVHTERAEGGIPAGAKVTVTARVDDQQIFVGQATVDEKGDAQTSFDLPKAMEKGDGTLSFAIEDGGTVETAAKTIPILLQTLDLAFFPEGGDAVNGISNRIYLEAKTPNKKPADLVGAIIDSKGNKVADVKTQHEGRARFEFTPQKGETYALKVSEPSGIAKTFPLPAAKDQGVMLHVKGDVIGKDTPVQVTYQEQGVHVAKLTLTQRETEVATGITLEGVNVPTATTAFTFNSWSKPDADGVLTLTAWDDKGVPLAERLIYREPAHIVQVTVTPDQSTYTPGGHAKLNITTTDETGKPVAASVGLTITDDSIQEMVEKREQAPRLPAMVLLEPEVKELMDAKTYLEGTGSIDGMTAKASLATDLLLGTQGWRHFATLNPTEFMTKYGDDAKRVLAFVKPPEIRRFAGGGGFGGGGGGRGGRGGALGGVAMGGPAMNRAEAADAAMPMAVPAPMMPQMEKGAVIDQLKHEAMPDANFDLQLQDKEALMPQAAAKLVPPPAGQPAAGFAAGGAAAARPMAPAAGGAMRIRGPVGGGGGGGFGGGGGAAAGLDLQQVAQGGDLVVVREYAHDLRPNWSPADRSDFTETVYWNADVKTDATGHASASFALADSVTTFRIFSDAFSKSGALGSSSSTVNSVQPFFIEPKLPLEVTAGDIIQLPVSAVNNTPNKLDKFSINIKAPAGLNISAADKPMASLDSQARVREMFSVTVNKPEDVDLTLNATGGDYSDNVTRKLRVRPTGFPTQVAYGGLLDESTAAKKDFFVPASVVPNSMKTSVTVYSSPVANLTDAVAALLREPNGCFEQTSSTNYPLAMAQLYFVNHQGVDPKLIAQGAQLLDNGYHKLAAFECQNKGYEWFGGAQPGHEALTAYGLMEFHDMQQAKVAVVDPQMVDRTSAWLIAREDGKGGFQRNEKQCDSFGGAPQETTNAYIVWALIQAGQKNLDREIEAVSKQAETSNDSYILALAANINAESSNADKAGFFMDKLAKKQNKEGAVDGGLTSITRSGGSALAIETTSLASLAWMKNKTFAANAQNGIKFLADNCKEGRFGSTQSTILALKAITAYDTANAHPKAAGKVTLVLDGAPVGDPVDFTADSKEPLKFNDFGNSLTPGQHSVSLQMAGGSQMPFSMAINYNSVTPATDDQCKLELQTYLKDNQIIEGNTTEARVVVNNKTDKDAASPIAIIGIPGGLSPRHDQLKELVKSGKIDAYEVNGREVVLYWRQIKANTKADLSISLIADVPGTYTAPASRAYEYYTDEFKQWAAGTKVVITPK